MLDFTYSSSEEITSAIAGKIVVRCTISTDTDDLCFEFTDGTTLILRYDRIYEWDLKAQMIKPNG